MLRPRQLGIVGDHRLGVSAAPVRAARRRAAARRSGSASRRAGGCRRAPPRRAAARSISASSKPSVCVGERAQPRRVLGAEQQADRRVGAAPDPPPQLVELRDPVAVGVLDQHHGRVRHVDPDLDHRGGDEHVGAARRELRPSPPAWRPGASGRAGARPRSPAAPRSRSRSNSAVAARAWSSVGLLHERADDERLPAGPQLLADPVVRASPLALGRADERLDRAGGRAGARAAP